MWKLRVAIISLLFCCFFTLGGCQKKSLINSLGMKLVLIPTGEFLMGSPTGEEERDDNEHRHLVKISRAFYAGVTEVTQGQWVKVMGNNPSANSSCGRECPVELVTWHEAVKFCNKLSEREDLKQAYWINGTFVFRNQDANGYRLPTEAEWEYACRAGTTTRFYAGDTESDLGRAGWYNGNSGRTIHPVGLKTPNAWGLYDMHGNVWEWNWDWYGKDYFLHSPLNNPAGPIGGLDRLHRGGGWNNGPKQSRSAFRWGVTPTGRTQFLGFRIVRSAK